MSLLEQDTTRKRWVDKKIWQIEFDVGNNDGGVYKVEAIQDNVVYTRKSELGYLPGLYYLVSWKGYPKEENTWESASVVQYLRKLISLFHKDNPDKPTATSLAINIALSMARPTVKPTEPLKRKKRQPANSTNKRAKKNWALFEFYRVFGQIWVTSMLDILSHTARDCTWPSTDLHQKLLLFDFQISCMARLSQPFKPQL